MEITPENQYVDVAFNMHISLSLSTTPSTVFFWFVISASEFEMQLHLFSKWTKI